MIRRLLAVLPPREARALRLLVVAYAVAAGLQAAGIAAAGWFADRWLTSADCTPPLVVLFATGVAYAVTQAWAQARGFRIGCDLARALHHRLGAHLARLPVGWFDRAHSALAQQACTHGVPVLMSFPALLLRPLVTAVVTPVVVGLTLLAVAPQVGAAVLVGFVVSAVVARWSDHIMARWEPRRHANADAATAALAEYARAQPLLRTYAHPAEPTEVEAALMSTARTDRALAWALVPGQAGFALTLQVALAGVLTSGLALVTGAALPAGALAGITVSVVRLAAIAGDGADLASALRLASGQLERVEQILAARPLPSPAQSTPADPGADAVVLSAVDFGGDGPDPVLRGVDLVVPRQGFVTVVGRSGSGKTTLLRAIARHEDARRGSVHVRGRDVREVSEEDLANDIGLVLQEVRLFDGTIEENVRAGRPDACPDSLRAALHGAAVDRLVADLPDGLQTRVGPGGAALSGGERQRVSIARALLKAAPLTLVDEGTSSLGELDADRVVTALRELSRTTAVVAVTHRMAIAARSDRVIVMEAGRVHDVGTPAELAGRCPAYQRLLAETN